MFFVCVSVYVCVYACMYYVATNFKGALIREGRLEGRLFQNAQIWKTKISGSCSNRTIAAKIGMVVPHDNNLQE